MGASLLLSLIAAGPVLATHVAPELVEGNPVCTGEGGPSGPSLGFDSGIKLEPQPPTEGDYTVGPGTVTISDIDTSVNPATFTWTSDGVTVLAVIVKGGPNANVYYYNDPPDAPAATTDDGLHAPNGFSHVEICYDDTPPPPETGDLKVTKDVKGGPEGFEGSFDIEVDCGEAGQFEETIDYPDPGKVVIEDIDAGAECTVTEVGGSDAPDGFEWGDVTYTGNPATIMSGQKVTVGVVNELVERPETPTLVIEKSHDAPLVNGLPSANEGDRVGYFLDYFVTNGPVEDAIIEDVLPVGVTYVVGSAGDSLSGEFLFNGYDDATRTLTWLATEVTANGFVSYEISIDADAAELAQPLTNTACISSDDTDEDCDDADVFVGAPPLAETSNPTPPQTDVLGPTETSASGASMLLVLLALAGVVLAVVFVAPTPASIRKRMR